MTWKVVEPMRYWMVPSNKVHKKPMQRKSPLQGFDGQRNQTLDDYFLDHYYTQPPKMPQTDKESNKWQLVYIPTNFKDFRTSVVD